jgi:cyclohexanone monooxygenase
VDIVNLKETPIERIEAEGIRTADGQLHTLDVIVLATGFDAVEGNYNRVHIHGKNNISLKDEWDQTGPTAYLGIFIPDFPNFMMINGPKGIFTNQPPAIETQVEFVSKVVAKAGKSLDHPVEVTHEAEREYSALCEKLAANSLFWKAEVSVDTVESDYSASDC